MKKAWLFILLLLWSASPAIAANYSGSATGAEIDQLHGKTLSTMAIQNATAVNIGGGTINGTPIGGTTPAAGAFTGIVIQSIKPAVDSTTAIQHTNANGSQVLLNEDTTNMQLGVCTTNPQGRFGVKGALASDQATLGSQLISNVGKDSTFATSPTDWTGTGWTQTGGVWGTTTANVTTLANTYLSSPITSGQYYRISLVIDTTHSGTLSIALGGAAQSFPIYLDVAGSGNSFYAIVGPALNSSAISISPLSGWNGDISQVVIQTITPASPIFTLRNSADSFSTGFYDTGGPGNLEIGANTGQFISTTTNIGADGYNLAFGSFAGEYLTDQAGGNLLYGPYAGQHCSNCQQVTAIGAGAFLNGTNLNCDIGIGVGAGTAEIDNNKIHISADGGGAIDVFKADGQTGHVGEAGAPVPTLGSCGTSPTIVTGSNDVYGTITEGSVATGCVITFNTAYVNRPMCTVTSESGLTFSYTVTSSAITITNIGALSSHTLDYFCQTLHTSLYDE